VEGLGNQRLAGRPDNLISASIEPPNCLNNKNIIFATRVYMLPLAAVGQPLRMRLENAIDDRPRALSVWLKDQARGAG
jgi:hypothetical protein